MRGLGGEGRGAREEDLRVLGCLSTGCLGNQQVSASQSASRLLVEYSGGLKPVDSVALMEVPDSEVCGWADVPDYIQSGPGLY